MHIHWHRFHHRAGVNYYFQCRCGSRAVRRPASGGVSPIDITWLNTGDAPHQTEGPLPAQWPLGA